jgi:predicted RNase H-like HicB family nuclease
MMLEVIVLKTYNFTILIEKDEDGIYVATVPALKGCHTQAKSLEEIYPRIKEAIGLYLEADDLTNTEILQNTFIGVQQLEISI